MKNEEKTISGLLIYISTIVTMLSIGMAFIAFPEVNGHYSLLVWATLGAAVAAVAILIFLKKKRISTRKIFAIHEITEVFQNALIEAWKEKDLQKHLQIEHNAVQVFCEKTRDYIEAISNARCTVTIDLITVVNADQLEMYPEINQYASTRLRSIRKDFHFETGSEYYDLIFSNKKKYIYRPNLSSDGIYRHDYLYRNDYYDISNEFKSLLVLPIKGIIPQSNTHGILGFLSFYSPTINAFKDNDLVQIAEYLAKQVWFFMSTVRGVYQDSGMYNNVH